MRKTFLICLLHASLLFIIGCGSDSDSSDSTPPPVDEEGSDAATDEGIDGVNDLINDLAGAPENTSANLAAAHSSFQEAVSLNPDNGTARMFLAATTMSSFFEEGQASITTSTLGGLLDDFGFGPTNRSLSDLASGLIPTTPSGNFDSSTPNLGRVQDWLADEIFLELFDTIANHLEAVPESFRDTITIDGIDIEIDCADARMIAALFRLAQVAVLAPMAFDFDMNLTAVNENWLVELPWSGEPRKQYVPYRLYSGGQSEFQAIDGWLWHWGETRNGPEWFLEHHNFLHLRPSLIGTPATGASDFLETTFDETAGEDDRMDLARIRLIKAINNILVAGPLLLDETANQQETGLISIDENALGLTALMDWITPMPDALDSYTAVLIPGVEDPDRLRNYPEIELSRQILDSQTYSGRPFLPTPPFGVGVYGAEVATAASFDSSNLEAVFTGLTNQHMSEVYSSLSVAFEKAMNGASQVNEGWHEGYYSYKGVGNWQYSDEVFPYENIFGYDGVAPAPGDGDGGGAPGGEQ